MQVNTRSCQYQFLLTLMEIRRSVLRPDRLKSLVRLLVFQADLVDQLCIEFDLLYHFHRPRTCVCLRVINRDLEFEASEAGSSARARLRMELDRYESIRNE